MLVTNAVAKVGYDEVLLTYAHSSTIYSILLHAHKVSRHVRSVQHSTLRFCILWLNFDSEEKQWDTREGPGFH